MVDILLFILLRSTYYYCHETVKTASDFGKREKIRKLVHSLLIRTIFFPIIDNLFSNENKCFAKRGIRKADLQVAMRVLNH